MLANLGVNTKVEVVHPPVPHVDYECLVNWTSGGVRDSKMYLCVQVCVCFPNVRHVSVV